MIKLIKILFGYENVKQIQVDGVDLTTLDKFMLLRTHSAQEKMIQCFENFDF